MQAKKTCAQNPIVADIMARSTEQLPDPWLFDSEALLRELDRCRETVLQIPITDANATHFGIQLAVNAIWNLTQNLRYLLHLHREQQRAIRRQHDQQLAQATAANDNVIRMSSAPTPTNHACKNAQAYPRRSHSRRGT